MVGWFLTPSQVKCAAVRPMARVGGLMALVLAAAVASTASAEPMLDSGLASSLDVIVKGKITASCRLSGGGDIDFGELTGGQQVEADFGLSCNVPFDISFQSQSGGLAHVTKPRGEGPFAGRLGYTLNVAIPTINPNPAVLSGTFDSENLIAKKTLSSGEGIAQGGGRIRILTNRPSESGLLAGEYSEVLNITLAPRV
ncbi:hypothetical protein [Brevundimonas sp. P7753]|uniref:hypothetical protein n=1 Tax=Brevundimonas sp. P7753 TaxID=2726982 RepID=UPI0015BF0790|nr:hypothetical protein [Brevundimonas sp. P7753]NWE52507.1 hypothetical protein [Brevundimonas sp. P7753]